MCRKHYQSVSCQKHRRWSFPKHSINARTTTNRPLQLALMFSTPCGTQFLRSMVKFKCWHTAEHTSIIKRLETMEADSSKRSYIRQNQGSSQSIDQERTQSHHVCSNNRLCEAMALTTTERISHTTGRQMTHFLQGQS